MSDETANYGSWLPKKLLYLFFLTSLIFLVISLFPLFFFLKIVFWSLTGLSLLIFLYFLYAYYIFNKNGREFQDRLWNIVLEKLEWNGKGKERKGKALDIGTGAGTLAIMLSKKLPEAKILGIDYWGKGWDYSKKLCEENAKIEGVSNQINFQKASAANMPFNDGDFDAAVSNFVFHEVRQAKDRRDVIKEALRIVRKGGVFSFQDLFLSKHYYGEINDLLDTIRGWGVQDITFINTNKLLKIPRLLRTSMMLGKIGIFYGKK